MNKIINKKDVMKSMLERFLKHHRDIDYIYIDYYNVDGASCHVVYYTDEERNYKVIATINIWDVMAFLNAA